MLICCYILLSKYIELFKLSLRAQYEAQNSTWTSKY